jgi:hypothetical protein
MYIFFCCSPEKRRHTAETGDRLPQPPPGIIQTDEVSPLFARTPASFFRSMPHQVLTEFWQFLYAGLMIYDGVVV